MGKPMAQKAAATEEKAPSPKADKGKASVSATTPAPAKNSTTQADVLAQIMAQIKKQSEEIAALKASF